MFKHTKTTKKTKVSFFNLFLTRKTELNSSMHFWHHYALKQIPLFALSLSRDCWKRDNKLSRTLSLTLLNVVGPSLTHTNTCTYFFLVPKDDDDDDETLFDLGLLFFDGVKEQRTVPQNFRSTFHALFWPFRVHQQALPVGGGTSSRFALILDPNERNKLHNLELFRGGTEIFCPQWHGPETRITLHFDEYQQEGSSSQYTRSLALWTPCSPIPAILLVVSSGCSGEKQKLCIRKKERSNWKGVAITTALFALKSLKSVENEIIEIPPKAAESNNN